MSTPPPTSAGINVEADVTVILRQGDVPRDYMVHTLAFNSTAGSVTSANYQALSDLILSYFNGTAGSFTQYNGSQVEVRLYNLSDAVPRPERAFSKYTPGSWASATLAPRQVALCSSFYAGRNLKRFRGRIYLGGYTASSIGERPTTTQMNAAANLVHGLAVAAQGMTPEWSQSIWSRADRALYAADHWWCNDTWDTMRSRQDKETTRVHIP